MAFERRKIYGFYMYVSYRDPTTGAVKKRYLGRGKRAKTAAKAIAKRQEDRHAEALAVQQARADLHSVDRLTEELQGAVNLLAEAVLLAEGFHRTNDGPWRKHRDGH